MINLFVHCNNLNMNKDEINLLISDCCFNMNQQLEDIKVYLNMYNEGNLPYGSKENLKKLESICNKGNKLGTKISPYIMGKEGNEEDFHQLSDLKDRLSD